MKKDKLSLKTEILKEIFKIAPKKFKETEKDNIILAKKFNSSKEFIQENLNFLFDMRLIRKFPGDTYKKDRIFQWELTDEGLEYLEKKQEGEKQEQFNKIVAFTGAILALTSIYYFLVNSLNLKDSNVYGTITYIFLMLILIFCLGPLVSFIINFWQKEVFGK
jgi:hypothetical protein